MDDETSFEKVQDEKPKTSKFPKILLGLSLTLLLVSLAFYQKGRDDFGQASNIPLTRPENTCVYVDDPSNPFLLSNYETCMYVFNNFTMTKYNQDVDHVSREINRAKSEKTQGLG